jgi:FkbM family methyltransferase
MSCGMNNKNYSYKIGKYTAMIPKGHELHLHQSNHPLYDRYFAKWLGMINPKLRILDIGANIGDSALFFATHSRGEIIAIEPVPQFFNLLLENISKNKLIDRISAQQLALIPGNFGSKVSLTINRGTASTKLTIPRFAKRKKLVQPQNFVDFLSQNDSFDLIKTDTDGLYLYLVQDLLKSRIATGSVLFFELDHFHYGKDWSKKFTKLCSEFEDQNYRIIMVDNLGRPFYSPRSEFKEIIQFYSWLNKQKNMSFRSAYYFDIWAFPKNHQDAYDSIIELERMNL